MVEVQPALPECTRWNDRRCRHALAVRDFPPSWDFDSILPGRVGKEASGQEFAAAALTARNRGRSWKRFTAEVANSGQGDAASSSRSWPARPFQLGFELADSFFGVGAGLGFGVGAAGLGLARRASVSARA